MIAQCELESLKTLEQLRGFTESAVVSGLAEKGREKAHALVAAM